MNPIFDALVADFARRTAHTEAAIRRAENHRRAVAKVGDGFLGAQVLLAVTSNA